MNRQKSLNELAAMVGGTVIGDGEVLIRGVNDIDFAEEDEIAFFVKKNDLERLARTKACAVVVPPGLPSTDKALLQHPNPVLAFTNIHAWFLEKPFLAAGIHPSAVIGEGCTIPEEVTIGPLAVLGQDISLGVRTTIHPHAVIGDNVVLGDDCVIHPHVTIYPGVRIGNRVIIHSGSVVGSDGYGYVPDEKGRHVKRPHVGTVEIDDDVEIGSNVCIDRGTFGKTRIGRGTKIDNLVQIGHNVEVGEHTLLVAQVGIAGSSALGDRVVLGGKVGVAGHTRLGKGVMAAAMSGIAGDLPAGSVVGGIPAIPQKQWLRASVAFARLPDLLHEIRELKETVNSLKKDEEKT